MQVRQRVWQLVETAEGDDRASRVVDAFIVALILLSTLVLILDSVPGLLAPYAEAVRGFEFLVIVVFTAEYLLRLWSCTADPRFTRPIAGRLRFATTPLALIDLVAILPFYLPWIVPGGFLALRLLRLLRLLKFSRYSHAPQNVVRAFQRRRGELLSALFVLLLLLVSMASLLYLAENPHRPELYSSIPESMWWSILALTGNGQVAPITVAGRIVASVIAIIGVGLFALPAGLLASSFTEELSSPTDAARVADPAVERMTRRAALAHVERMREMRGDVGEGYSEEAVILTPEGIRRGMGAAAEIASARARESDESGWRLVGLEVAGRTALLLWQATDPGGAPLRAADTIFVNEGLIELQSTDR